MNECIRAINVPHYQLGIPIIHAQPKDVIRNISNSPTLDYYHTYHRLNNKLDELAILCAKYIKGQGYNAYPQTVSVTKEYAAFRTVMPHKSRFILTNTNTKSGYPITGSRFSYVEYPFHSTKL